MKLAITASACTGKSTLARSLSERLGCALIEEHYGQLFDEQGDFIQPPETLKRLIEETLEYKHTLESAQAHFISDRSPVDLFNLWLSRGFAQYQAETSGLYRQCRAYILKYDAVLVLPWGVLPLRQVDMEKEQRQRVMNPWIQFQNHSTIIGLISQWMEPDKIVPLPPHIKDIEARLHYVVEKLRLS